jgi:hypothetical protein
MCFFFGRSLYREPRPMRSGTRPGAHERSDPAIGITDRDRRRRGAERSPEPRNGATAEHGPHRPKSCPRIGRRSVRRPAPRPMRTAARHGEPGTGPPLRPWPHRFNGCRRIGRRSVSPNGTTADAERKGHRSPGTGQPPSMARTGPRAAHGSAADRCADRDRQNYGRPMRSGPRRLSPGRRNLR